MAAPLEMTPESQPEAVLEGVSGAAIEGRSLGQIAWMRLRRDKVAIGGGIFILFLIVVALVGPLLVQNPDVYHSGLINPTYSRPNGTLGATMTGQPAARAAAAPLGESSSTTHPPGAIPSRAVASR